MINKQFTNSNIVDIKNNPQMTSDSPVKGMFVFTRLPKGTYNITVEKDGYFSSEIITADEGSGTLSPIVILSGYGEKPSAVVNPSATTQATPGQGEPTRHRTRHRSYPRFTISSNYCQWPPSARSWCSVLWSWRCSPILKSRRKRAIINTFH